MCVWRITLALTLTIIGALVAATARRVSWRAARPPVAHIRRRLLLPVIARRLSAARVRPALRAGAQIAGSARIVEWIVHRVGLLRAVFAAGIVLVGARLVVIIRRIAASLIWPLASTLTAALIPATHVCTGLTPGIV
jgi:hypothetical protein